MGNLRRHKLGVKKAGVQVGPCTYVRFCSLRRNPKGKCSKRIVYDFGVHLHLVIHESKVRPNIAIVCFPSNMPICVGARAELGF